MSMHHCMHHCFYVSSLYREGKKGGPVEHHGVSIKYERSFKWKVERFRKLCSVSAEDANMNIIVKKHGH